MNKTRKKNMRLYLCKVLLRRLAVVAAVFVVGVTLFRCVQKNTQKNAEIINKFDADLHITSYEGNNLGLGEYGVAAEMPKNMTEHEWKLHEEGCKNYGIDKVLSDKIGTRRKLKDVRPDECKETKKYPDNLPQTDIIICLYMEPWSTLIRTVHSVLDRTPYHLIKHIILVDDFSETEYTGKPLEDYWSMREPKIKIIRTTRREGLIRAKILGFNYGTAPVATFLDAHCECIVGWLEPLLDRVAKNPSTVACPTIDFISHKTFGYTFVQLWRPWVGGFNWDLKFKWMWQQQSEATRRVTSADPLRTPVMAGGLFSINREFFKKLGTYDEGFNIWGGENLELSFKTWMCGGVLEILPCSRVGHVAKTHHPYNFSDAIISVNNRRLAKVWMDEYEKYFLELMNPEFVHEPIGDTGHREELRRNLGCHSFKWYLDNIYPELFRPESEVVKFVEISVLNGTYCLDAVPFKMKDFLNVVRCTGKGGDQKWAITPKWEITRDYCSKCLQYNKNTLVVGLEICHRNLGRQQWYYDNISQRLMNMGQCLTVNIKNFTLSVSKCDINLREQIWELRTIE